MICSFSVLFHFISLSENLPPLSQSVQVNVKLMYLISSLEILNVINPLYPKKEWKTEDAKIIWWCDTDIFRGFFFSTARWCKTEIGSHLKSKIKRNDLLVDDKSICSKVFWKDGSSSGFVKILYLSSDLRLTRNFRLQIINIYEWSQFLNKIRVASFV